VNFNQPVYFYVENFLDFPVGETVPAGYYDKEKSAWVPSDSGVIIEILGDLDGDGMTEIDSDGDEVPDDATTLTDLGFTDEERENLTITYTTGQTLWRVPMEHFSSWDCNWGFGPPDDAEEPKQNPDNDIIKDEDKSCKKSGSIIECQNQILGERIPVIGTPFSLNYRSDRVPGRKASATLNIQVTGDTIPSSLDSVMLEITIAGRIFEIELSAKVNQSYEFVWDGLDTYGREMSGTQTANVRIGYVYRGVYRSTSRFGYNGNGAITGSKTRQTVTLWQTYTTSVGSMNQKKLGIGGWSISAQHQYDTGEKIIYFGSGDKRSSKSVTNYIETIVGTGISGYSGDGWLATSAKLYQPDDIVLDKKGNLFIADTSNHVIRKVDKSGVITTIAGTGSRGYSGDGGLATSAKLYFPSGIAIDNEGNLFIADEENNAIRKVDTYGIITTVAGTGSEGYSGDGGLATSAKLDYPYGIAVDNEGNLFIADKYNNVIRKVDTSGIITTVAGTGSEGYIGDGGPAINAELAYPNDVAIDEWGNLFILDRSNHVVRKVDVSGIITTIAGRVFDDSGDNPLLEDGMLATSGYFNPMDITADKKGNIFIGELAKIIKVDTTGIATRIAGEVYLGYTGDGGPPTSARLSYCFGVAVDQDGNVFIADTYNNVIRKVNSQFPGFVNADIAISSEDGTELYKFNSVGLHQSTVDTKTGTTLYTFGYDENNLLETITDEDGSITTINHDADGNPTSIVSSYGQTTTFEVDDNGYLKTVTNPAGESYSMTYDDDGLLQTFTNSRGNSSNFEYDDLGYLEKDTDAAGNAQNLSRENTDDGYQVTHTSPEGLTSIYKVETDSGDEKTWTNTWPDGTESTTIFGTDGSKTITAPDGTVTIEEIGPDPRFGMESPLPESASITTPSGLDYQYSMERSVVLSDEDDLLTLTAQTDTITLNGKTYTNIYESTSQEETLTTPELRKRVTTLDSKGKITEQQIGSLEPVTYTYDSNGRLSTLTYGTTTPRVYTLNYYSEEGTSKGLLESIIGLSSQTTEYTYNKDKQLDLITRPDGKTIDYDYDSAGRLATIDAYGDTYTYAYSPTTGLLTSISDPSGGALSFTYDGGLLLTATLTGEVSGSVGFTYDENFWVTKQTINSTTSYNFDYDDDGLLTTAGSLSLTRSSDHGMITSTTLSSITSSIEYTEIGELESEDFSYGGTSIYSTTYTTRDELGRITEKEVTNSGSTIPCTYTYDSAGRLETATYVASTTTYTYDDNGNRLTKTKDGVTTAATYDDQDRLETYGDNTYTYTDNGELLTKTNTEGITTYDYDILGNLKTVSLPDGTEIEYVIDAQNQRVGKKESGILTQGFIYKNQLKPIAELDGSNNIVSTFVYASKSNIPDYMVKGGVTYRIISDRLGSPQLIINVSDGSIAQEITYDEFGNILSDTNPGFQPFGFAGGIYDADTKLTRFGARDYDAETGRWTAKDPIDFSGEDSNLYVYVFNDPINLIDPEGLIALPLELGLLGGEIGTSLLPGIGTVIGGAVGLGVGIILAEELLDFIQDKSCPIQNSPKDRNPNPIGKRNRSNTKKDAYEKAKKAGKGNEPVNHPDGEHGPHYHPGDENGKPLNHDHYNYPKGRR